jgi:hypothetical protein
MIIDLSDQKVIEEAAIALHRSVWNYTSPWEYENPKLKDHYRDSARVVFGVLSRIASVSSHHRAQE